MRKLLILLFCTCVFGAELSAQVFSVEKVDTLKPYRNSNITFVPPLASNVPRSLRASTNSLNARIDSLSARIDSLQAIADSLGRAIDSLKATVGRLNARMDALEARMQAINAELDAMRARLEALEARVGILELRTDAITGTLDTLKATMDSLGARFGVLTDKFDVLNSRVDFLSTRLDSLGNVLADSMRVGNFYASYVRIDSGVYAQTFNSTRNYWDWRNVSGDALYYFYTRNADTLVPKSYIDSLFATSGGGSSVASRCAATDVTNSDGVLADDAVLYATIGGTTDHAFAQGSIWAGYFDLFFQFGTGATGVKIGFTTPDSAYSVLDAFIDYWKVPASNDTAWTRQFTVEKNYVSGSSNTLDMGQVAGTYATVRVGFRLDNAYGYSGDFKIQWASKSAHNATRLRGSQLVAYRIY